ncbi:capsid protein 1D [Sesbania bispinosa]|nr:capsid protein 1D [Sesbania bispinosa]
MAIWRRDSLINLETSKSDFLSIEKLLRYNGSEMTKHVVRVSTSTLFAQIPEPDIILSSAAFVAR